MVQVLSSKFDRKYKLWQQVRRGSSGRLEKHGALTFVVRRSSSSADWRQVRCFLPFIVSTDTN